MAENSLEVRHVCICRLCRRELEIEPKYRANGAVHINMKCPKHGVLRLGERYLQAYKS